MYILKYGNGDVLRVSRSQTICAMRTRTGRSACAPGTVLVSSPTQYCAGEETRLHNIVYTLHALILVYSLERDATTSYEELQNIHTINK